MLNVFSNLFNNHLEQFIKSYQNEPQMFLALGKDIKEHALQLSQLPHAFEEGAVEIVNLMAKETYLVDLFTQAIADENVEVIKPGVFLEKADNVPDIDPEASQELIAVVSHALETMSENNLQNFPPLYYENYFGEYLTNIFFVSAIELLSLFINKKNFLNN